MVLVEALEAIIKVDWRSERRVKCEGDPTGRIGRVIGVVLAGRAGVVVSQIDLLCVGRGFEQDEAERDADGACVRAGVLRMV